MLLTLFGVSVLSFALIRLIPGDAAQITVGANSEASAGQIAAMRTQLGLDQPLAVQYWLWAGRALSGDLGRSLWTGTPVLDEVLPRIGITFELTVLALAAATVLAVPLGCAMALARRPATQAVTRLASIVGITMPSFWLATMLLYGATALLPGAQLLGWIPFAEDPIGHLQRLALPVLALALPATAALARILRATLVDVLRQDYIRTARAKGLSPAPVLFSHALRNALLPFLTSLGILAGYQFGGAVVVEQVFAIPGLGRLILGAIAERNYPLVQASILLATAIFVLVNAATDLLYLAADPRLRQA